MWEGYVMYYCVLHIEIQRTTIKLLKIQIEFVFFTFEFPLLHPSLHTC